MSAENRLRQDARLRAVSLRYAIISALDGRGITTASSIGEAMGMPANAAAGLLNRRHLLGGDLAQLKAVCAWLGIEF
jgi:hypothetical protein